MKKRGLRTAVDRLQEENATLRASVDRVVAVATRNYVAGMDLARHIALGTDVTDLSALTALEELRRRPAAPGKGRA